MTTPPVPVGAVTYQLQEALKLHVFLVELLDTGKPDGLADTCSKRGPEMFQSAPEDAQKKLQRRAVRDVPCGLQRHCCQQSCHHCSSAQARKHVIELRSTGQK